MVYPVKETKIPKENKYARERKNACLIRSFTIDEKCPGLNSSTKFNLRKLRKFAIIVIFVKFAAGGGGGTLYNGLYSEAPPERGTFFRLEVYDKVGIS